MAEGRRDPWLEEHGYATAKRRALEHPEGITKRSTVTVTDEDFETQDFIVTTVRVPGDSGGVHVSFVEWVDRWGVGQRFALPGKVVSKMQDHIKSSNRERKSEVGKRAHQRPAEVGMLGDTVQKE
jgi:hypothetical protein